MAESAVTFLLEKLSKLVEDELKLLGGARGDFVSIRGELEIMRAFLRAADAMEDSDPQLQAWVKQVRDVANDTDDVVDDFTHRLPRRHGHGFFGSLSRIYHQMKNIKFRDQIVSEIREIKGRVKEIAERRLRYNFKLSASEQGSSSHAANNSCYDRRGDALLVEEADLVGIDKPRQQLVDWLLLDDDSRLKVVSVYGMGGLGKTTLVKKVYEDAEVKRQFQNHGWVTFSQSFKIEELLKDLILNLCDEAGQPLPQRMETMDTNRLKEVLKELLRDTKYVLVLDDVWSKDAWDAIKYALPNCDCGSRVLLTTRIREVASASSRESHGYFYEMKALSLEESWTLFCKKTFHGNDCPQNLKDVSENILKRCEGLPLAIVVIAGVFASKDQIRVDELEMVNRSLGSEVEGTDIKKILLLSYSDLPYYLKPCLLYLSGFPEDYQIKWTRSIRLLVAERFVEEKKGKTLEEVAESYLYELLNRSLIQVASRGLDQKVEKCRIHDLLREVILLKSKNQNFLAISGEGSAALPEKVIRLSIHSTLRNIPRDHCFLQLRSLLIFGVDDPLTESSMPMLFNGGSRLKTLDLEGASLKTFPGGVVKCYHLTYLSLRGTKVKVLPNTIRNLKNLQTLDLLETYVSELPTEILRLQGLRHLLVSNIGTDQTSFHYVRGFKAPSKIGELQNLQSLVFIEANSVSGSTIVEEIGRLTQLRELGIVGLRREDGAALCSSIAKLSNLQKLYVASTGVDEILDLQSLSPAPQLLQYLYLNGCLEKLPQWIAPLHGLTTLVLTFSKFRGDVDDHVLQSLQHLPSLVYLFLGEQAYDGEELCFDVGGFQRLKRLRLVGLHGLRRVTVEEGATPLLEELTIASCELMEELPSGIELLSNLKRLHLVGLSDGLISKLNRRDVQGGDYWKIAHIPKVWIGNLTEDGTLVGSYL